MPVLLNRAIGLARGGEAVVNREIRLVCGALVEPGIGTWLGLGLAEGHDPRKCLSRLRTGPDRRRPGGALCRPLRSPERGRDRTRTARTKPEIPPIDVGVTIGA